MTFVFAAVAIVYLPGFIKLIHIKIERDGAKMWGLTLPERKPQNSDDNENDFIGVAYGIHFGKKKVLGTTQQSMLLLK